jgi:hypothetical protein
MIAPLLALGCGAFVSHFLAGGLPSGTQVGYSLEVRPIVAVTEEVESLPFGTESEPLVGTLRLDYPRYPQVAGKLLGDVEISTVNGEVMLDGARASCPGERLLYATVDEALIIVELGEPRVD